MPKFRIKNRKQQTIVILFEQIPQQRNLAFVMHGLGGFKEEPHIQTFAQAFKDQGCTVVRFDAINSYGESAGEYAEATTTNYLADLEDVISWASRQKWYQEPFFLCGHSLGAFCSGLYAQKYPQKVKALALISTVVSGKLSLKAPKNKDIWREWEKTGWEEHESTSLPGVIKRLKWDHMEDRLCYDLLKKVDRLTMPVMLIVGDRDQSTPPAHQKILYQKLPGPKELHIIKGAPHSFRAKKHLEEIKKIFDQWIEKDK